MISHLAPFEHSRSVLTLSWRAFAFIAGALIASAIMGMLIGGGTLTLLMVASAAVVLGLVGLPWVSPGFAIVVLAFAGRYPFGPFASGLMDVSFWTAIGIFILLIAPNKLSIGRLRWKRASVILFLVFLGFVALSVQPTFGAVYGSEKAFRVLVYGPLFLIIGQLLLNTPARMQKFFLNFIGFIDFFALASVALAIGSHGLSGILRIAPPGGGPITLARLTGFATIACVGLAMQHNWRKLLLLNGFLLLVITFMTGSRAPALFLVLVLLIIPLVSSVNGNSRRQVAPLVILILLAALLAFPAWNFAIDHQLSFAERFALLTSNDKGVSVGAREDFYGAALDISRQAGGAAQGIGSWPILYYGRDFQAYPHNVFLEILVEQGILALMVFILFLMTVVASLLAKLKSRSTQGQDLSMCIIGFLSLLFALMVAQTSGDLYDNRFIWFFAGICLACVSLNRQDTELSESAIQ